MLSIKRIVLMFMVVILYVPVASLASTVDLPRTGQTTCYDTSGNVIDCAGTGQDGDIQAGVAWPNPRFTGGAGIEADCITDNLTGLMWTKAPDSTIRTWQEALDYSNGFSLCGYSDWRLPNVLELESLINVGETFTPPWLNTQGFMIGSIDFASWSSTSGVSGAGDHGAWSIEMGRGELAVGDKSSHLFAWPVRSAQPGAAPLWHTGQTNCYDNNGNIIDCTGTGQDGDIQAGVALPSPRFTVEYQTPNNSCIRDNLTGLMWMWDTGPSDSYLTTWQSALAYANGLSLCGFTDWRLPNRKELLSRVFPGVPTGVDFFYWTSTTYTSSPDRAWLDYTWFGYTGADPKSFNAYVWPVRSGEVGQSAYSISGTVTKYNVYGTALDSSGVTVMLSGSSSATTTTAADGTYSFTGLVDGSYTITPRLFDTGSYPGTGYHYTFTPASRSVTVAEDSVTLQDFSADPHISRRINDDAVPGDKRYPWVDYNESTGEYLVLWQDKRNGTNDDIYGVRLDQNGSRIGSDFAVSTVSGHQQRVLVKAGGGGYLVLWHDLRNYGTNGADIYGAWIDGSGTVGPEMAICACAKDQWNPVAGYDPVSNTFLVVFLSGTGSGIGNDAFDLWGAVIPAGGMTGVIPFQMVTEQGGQRGPQIGYDYGNSQYYMAWNDRRGGVNYDIYGSRVTTTGTLLDGAGVLLSGAAGNQFRPTVLDRRPAAGINNHLIAWTDYRNGTQADVYGINVDGNGAAAGSDFAISTNAADQANVVADIDWTTTKKSLIGFIDQRNGVNYDIYGATVDQAGVITGDNEIVGPVTDTYAGGEQRAEVITYATDGVSDYGFLTVWMDQRYGTYHIRGIKVWP